jgi:hypothetical protein
MNVAPFSNIIFVLDGQEGDRLLKAVFRGVYNYVPVIFFIHEFPERKVAEFGFFNISALLVIIVVLGKMGFRKCVDVVENFDCFCKHGGLLFFILFWVSL